MATRLEKETVLREKAQLQAKLDKLFATQEAQTAGKKKGKAFCRGGKVKRKMEGGGSMWPDLSNIWPNIKRGFGGGNDNPGYPGLGGNPYPQEFSWSDIWPDFSNIGGNLRKSVGMSPTEQAGPRYQGMGPVAQAPSYVDQFMPNFQYGSQAPGINGTSGATQWDVEGTGGGGQPAANAAVAGGGSYSGVPNVPVQSTMRGTGQASIDPMYAQQNLFGNNSFGGSPRMYSFSGGSNTGLQQYGGPGAGALSGLGTNKFSTPQSGNTQGMFPNQGRGLMQGLSTALSFAGPMFDIGRGLSKATQFNPQDYYNPQYNRAISEYDKGIGLMRNRRYDPSAELEEVERSGAVYRQNIRNLPTSTGGLYNRLSAATSREQRAKGGIRSKKQNIDLGYRGEEAQYRAGAARGIAGLGSERAQTRFMISDYNERAKAQRRNLLSAGLGGLGMGMQNQQLMMNQRMRDQQLGQGVLPSYGGGMYNYGQQGNVQFGGQPMDQEGWRKYILGY